MAKALKPKFTKKYLLRLPQSHFDRMLELCQGRYESIAEYFRALTRREILAHGPLPREVRGSKPAE